MTKEFKAQKRSIETFALQYNGYNTELVLDLLNKNESEPAILEEDSQTILITKTFGVKNNQFYCRLTIGCY